MLRVLSGFGKSAAMPVFAVVVGGLAFADGATTGPSAHDTAAASKQAADALEAADQLTRQRNFLDALQRGRAGAATVEPGPNPQIDLGGLSQPPTTADVINTVRNPPRPNWSETNQAPPLLLVSFSMPDSDLRELARQSAKIGASLILRGLVDNSFTATQRRLASFKDIPGASFMVDPTLFRRFGVTSVPTFVLPLDALSVCSNDIHCEVPAHVSVAGESGLDHILDEINRRARDPRARKRAAELQVLLKSSS